MDFGADIRVPTPSAGAEISVPDISLMLDNAIENLSLSGNVIKDRISSKKDLLADSLNNLGTNLYLLFSSLKNDLSSKEKNLQSLSPLNILSRGYAYITKDKQNVNSIHQLQNGDQIDISLSDGELTCIIDEVKHINEQ